MANELFPSSQSVSSDSNTAWRRDESRCLYEPLNDTLMTSNDFLTNPVVFLIALVAVVVVDDISMHAILTTSFFLSNTFEGVVVLFDNEGRDIYTNS